MDFNQFILALRARRKAFLIILAATIVTAVAIALLLPKSYVSTTTIMLGERDEQTMVAGSRMSARERGSYLQTQVDLLTSGRVAKRVVRDLNYLQKPGMREQYERETGGLGTIEDWAANTLLKKVKAETSGSYTIAVNVTDSNPKLAADVANAFAKAYADISLELRTEPTREAAAWFEDQLKGLRANVSQAQQKLTGYQKERGITSTDERTDVEAVRLAELSTQLMAARNATYEAQSRYKHASEFLAGNASTGASVSADSLPEVMASPAVQALKTALVAA